MVLKIPHFHKVKDEPKRESLLREFYYSLTFLIGSFSELEGLHQAGYAQVVIIGNVIENDTSDYFVKLSG